MKLETKFLVVVDKDGYYAVYNKKDMNLGVIEYYANWKKYVFCPRADTFYDSTCVQDLTNILKHLDIHKSLDGFKDGFARSK
jgi:hypothetical protein